MDATRNSWARKIHETEHFRTLVQLAPDVMYALSAEGTFTSLSPAFTEVTGWQTEDWIGKPFAGIIHPDDLPRAVENFRQTMLGEIPTPYEIRVLAKSTDFLVAEVRGIPIFEEGRVVGSIGVARDVTARVRAERELKESRDQLDAILQSVDDGITVQEPDGRVIYANAAAARIIGLPSADPGVLPVSDQTVQGFEVFDELGHRFSAEDLPNRRALRGEEPDEILLRYRKVGDSDLHWSELRSRPVFDMDGQVRLVVNVFKDVTERHRAQEIRLQLGAIVQSSDDAIIGKNLDAVVTSWNRGAERLYGYTSEEMIGTSLAVLVPPERPDELPGIMARLRRGEKIEPHETVRVRKDGSRITVWVSVSPIRDASGVVTGAASIARDITALKRADMERAALLAREQEARNRAEIAGGRLAFLARASEVLSSSLDYETTLSNLARLAVPALGDWCVIEIVEEDGSRRRVALTHPDPAMEAYARELEGRYPTSSSSGVDRVLETGKSVLVPEITEEMLVESATSDEHLRVIRGLRLSSGMVVPLPARGGVLGVITLLSAESRQRYGQEDLELLEDLGRRAAVAVDNARLYQAAQTALRQREEFLSIASHELKTPLTSLQLQIQILDRFVRQDTLATLPPERAMNILDGAERQVKRLSKLINDLLDVSRIAAGRLELERSDMELGRLVGEVVERFHEEAASAGAYIRLDAQPEIVGHWDGFRLDQVVTNLLSNAIKYGAGGAIDVRVFTSASQAHIEVRDQGIGIAPEDLERIFERFERMPSAQGFGGLGLGLYIASQIVEAQGGLIHAESQPDEGSTFTVSLPLGQ